MARELGRKLAHLAVVLFLVSIGTFWLTEVAPGDPAAAILGPTATPEQYARIHEELGFDEPVTSRYLDWIGDAVRGDFGDTLIPPVQSVTDLVLSRLPVTAEIAVAAMVIALAFAVPLGAWSASRAGGAVDSSVTAGSFAVLSMPSFLAAMILVYGAVLHAEGLQSAVTVLGCVLAGALLVRAVASALADRRRGVVVVPARLVRAGALAAALLTVGLTTTTWWPDLPRQGFVRLTDPEGLGAHFRSILLPALTLGLIEGAVLLRVLRSDLISILGQDFVQAARAKGITDRRILFRHALRPASLSLVTMAGVSFGRLLGGTMIMETIFRLPGMGTLMVDAVGEKDFRVVQAGVLVVSLLYVVVNIVVDLSCEALDPRIRRARR